MVVSGWNYSFWKMFEVINVLMDPDGIIRGAGVTFLHGLSQLGGEGVGKCFLNTLFIASWEDVEMFVLNTWRRNTDCCGFILSKKAKECFSFLHSEKPFFVWLFSLRPTMSNSVRTSVNLSTYVIFGAFAYSLTAKHMSCWWYIHNILQAWLSMQLFSSI